MFGAATYESLPALLGRLPDQHLKSPGCDPLNVKGRQVGQCIQIQFFYIGSDHAGVCNEAEHAFHRRRALRNRTLQPLEQLVPPDVIGLIHKLICERGAGVMAVAHTSVVRRRLALFTKPKLPVDGALCMPGRPLQLAIRMQHDCLLLKLKSLWP
jgi:hypothetical protein